ncbi:poly(A)-specific ribonuclease PARN-like isoform X2 [Convolutriloba macropyga]|uniref:poly(A)-specific ribonuclease PARN-like isoform X2 n=1 Tax=Convolutriloba macropyga TaxID=536237 RepID=UPI003F525423
MVDVTKFNFGAIRKSIKDVIDSCDFIAMDLELSGLNESNSKNSSDLPESRFLKCRRDVLKYSPIQVGIACFEYDASQKNKYIVRPYNFYVFPYHNSFQYPEKRIQFLTSSMCFLSTHGFDFNKWVNSGIPFLSVADEKRMKQQAMQSSENMRKEAKESDNQSEQRIRDAQVIKDAETENACFLKATRDKLKLLKEDNAEYFQLKTKLDELEMCVGFTHIMKMVSESGKVVVGHNMLLDILHLHHTFFHPVPENYEDFKISTTSIFPKLCDTKVLASTKPFKTYLSYTGLEQCYSAVFQKPFKKPPVAFAEGFDKKYCSGNAAHEAGYDAYMTGCVFVSFLNYIGSLVKPPKQHVPCSSDLLTPFVNKIFLMRIVDLYYMDLSNDDVIPTRDDMFYLTFPEQWKTRDIVKLFEEFGTFTKINWIDDTSCVAQVEGMRDPANTVKKSVLLRGADVENFSISTFAEYMLQCKAETESRANGSKVNMTKRANQGSVDLETSLSSASLKRSSDSSVGEDMGELVDSPELTGKKIRTE